MIDKFIKWCEVMKPMFRKVYGTDWQESMHAFLLAGCREDGSGLFPYPSSGRKLFDKDTKGKLYKVGHTAEQWLTYNQMIHVIKKRNKPCHVLFWHNDILCIDCDTVEDSEKFSQLCKRKRLSYAYEPSNHGAHFFFKRNPISWPSIFTNAVIDEGIVIDMCFGPKWILGERKLYLEDGTPVLIPGEYERGGRVLKTCITKLCWDESLLYCPPDVSTIRPGVFKWENYPYKTIAKKNNAHCSGERLSINLQLDEGGRNIGLTKALGMYVKQNPNSDITERLFWLRDINCKLPSPLPDRELMTIARSSMRWR